MQTTRSYLPTHKAKNFNALLKRWMFRTGIDPFTYAVRLAVILILMIFFVTPMLWLFTAPTKTNDQMLELPALAIGSLNYIPTAWMHLMSYLNGIVLRWILNSINYVVLGLILTLFLRKQKAFLLFSANRGCF